MSHHQRVNDCQPLKLPPAHAIAFYRQTLQRLHKGPVELKTSEFNMHTFKLNAWLAAQMEANEATIKHTNFRKP